MTVTPYGIAFVSIRLSFLSGPECGECVPCQVISVFKTSNGHVRWMNVTPVLACSLSGSHVVNGHQRIHTGYLQDADRMRTRQTTYQRTSNVHPPDIFIRWRPFDVLNMSKTCQQKEPDNNGSSATGKISCLVHLPISQSIYNVL